MSDKFDLKLATTLDLLRNAGVPASTLSEEGVIEPENGGPVLLEVMVQFSGTATALEAAGLMIISRFDDIVSGRIPIDRLEDLAGVETVIHIEGSNRMEPLLDLSVPDINADDVNTAPGVGNPAQVYTGRGVIVGIIDSGIDYRHTSFLKSDGTSRILSIWDQWGTGADAGGSIPAAPFSYGKEYTQAQINAALLNANPLTVVGHRDTSGHGTHVAGIAAGSHAVKPGVAPGADIIAVAYRWTDNTIMQAIDYIYRQAEALNRPCVINLSSGTSAGPHDGTTLKERSINKFVGLPNRAFSVAAGNSGNDNTFQTGTLAAGASATLTIGVTMAGFNNVSSEVWYSTGGQITAAVTDPSGFSIGPIAQPVAGASLTTLPAPNGDLLTLNFNAKQPRNNKDQIMMRGGYAAAPAGNWTIQLTNTGAIPVTYETWTTSPRDSGNFIGGSAPFSNTVMSPGTAREAICVGAYTTRVSGSNPVMGAVTGFSSRGPTADGRIKPDISAPGNLIDSAQSQDDGNGGGSASLVQMSGTSMAAPHIAGAIALLMEKTPGLTQEQIRRALVDTARTDAQTGRGNVVPNNNYGAGKLDNAALVNHVFTPNNSRAWVRVRSMFYNWTMGDTPPSFEIMSNENGRAIIELAWGSQDIPNPPARTVAEPIRYYHTDENLAGLTIVKNDGTNMNLTVPQQPIVLQNNRAIWTMPQNLWDAYREEMRKGMQTPSTGNMARMLYYRVRFEPSGAGSPIMWPADDSFNASPFNNRMNVIALNTSPNTQVVPDVAALGAMPRLKDQLEWLWAHLDTNNADRASLLNIFSHRLFTNSIETEIRGKFLTLWMLAGPARQKIHLLLERMFQTGSGLEMTVLKQPCLRENKMLIDHLLELANIVPHPDLPGVRVSEQVMDDVLNEIIDPNGQANQGNTVRGTPTAVQTLLINVNASEYVRLVKGLVSDTASATLGNGDTVTLPGGIFRAAIYAGDQADPFQTRTNSELAFQLAMMVSALGNRFPVHNAEAPPNEPRGANTILQRVMNTDLSPRQIEKLLEALFKKPFSRQSSAPSANLRNDFIEALLTANEPMLAQLNWAAPHGATGNYAQTVVALRSEAGRVFFKNPRYAGSSPAAAAMVANGSDVMPPRRLDDPTQSLESMGDDDLTNWVGGFYSAN